MWSSRSESRGQATCRSTAHQSKLSLLIVILSSVDTSDVSICVLSLQEAISLARSTDQDIGNIMITLPNDVLSHLKSDTIFVLNKTDLMRGPAQPSETEIREALRRALSPAMRDPSGHIPHVWTLSLRTGEGTREFLDGLAEVLKERVA